MISELVIRNFLIQYYQLMSTIDSWHIVIEENANKNIDTPVRRNPGSMMIELDSLLSLRYFGRIFNTLDMGLVITLMRLEIYEEDRFLTLAKVINSPSELPSKLHNSIATRGVFPDM